MRAVDLFAGLGGLTEGARLAGVKVRWCANHSPVAVRWHAVNHPDVEHVCQDLQQADFTTVPDHDILLAGPSCVGHTPARGKERPHHDAHRATAWAVVTCAEVKRPEVVICENVPAWSRWVLWPAWCAAMNALGYALSPIVLDAADSGVPQHRRRLFVVATRSRHPIELHLPKRKHRTAAEIIDFNAGRWSRVDKPGRAPATLARIAAGRRRFGDRFLAPYYGSGSGETGRSIDRPIGTLTTRARWAVINGNRMRMISVREGCRAFGLRDDYMLPESAAEAWQLLGNMVAPQQAADLIGAVRRAA